MTRKFRKPQCFGIGYGEDCVMCDCINSCKETKTKNDLIKLGFINK